jgi:ribose transport system substrate-binding protein
MKRHRKWAAVAAFAATVVFAGLANAELAKTKGPHGEDATPAKSLTMTPAQEAKIKEGKHTAALVWHTSSDYTTAVNQGALDEFARLGIDVVATTEAGFDAAKQRNDMETVMAKKPSVVLSLPVDPDTAASVYDAAKSAGTKLVFVDNSPKGYVYGQDYVAVVSDDLAQMGKKAGDAMGAALGGKGKIAYMFHDANFYVTNQRDGAFKQTILDGYKGIEIAAELGLADPAKAEEIANALLAQKPDIDGIYVTWAEPAELVLAALRNAGNKKTKIVTLDLSEPLALDMVKGGNVAAIVADEAYQIGVTAARAAALGLLEEKVAPFLVVDAIAVTKDNVKEGWNQSLHRDPPPSLATQ